jgi:hypothetical protein
MDFNVKLPQNPSTIMAEVWLFIIPHRHHSHIKRNQQKPTGIAGIKTKL